MSLERLIAVDWGTSSLRAWRFDAHGRVLAQHRSDQGLLKVPPGGFAAVLRTAVGSWLQRDSVLLLSGMVGSRQGWAEAPYAAAPCGANELAAALIEVPFDCRCFIVPGVMLRGIAAPDVMRGEETQLVGLDADADDDTGAGTGLAVLPGTHSKWVWREAGRITWFRTFMTGELFELLGQHGLLARSMSGEQIDAAGFAMGVAQARAPGGLLEKLFGLRARWLFGELAAEQQRGALSGLLLGTELNDALAALKREAGPGAARARRADLVASPALAQVYGPLLEAAGFEVRVADESAAARGLQRIAARAGLLSG
ncbi:MAG TPA: 2-dehydro-3-deoxygalactonokinase [Rhizobacter sp.]|nr:2-dehydro-3-deoxygalactonokinase [Rhizobacter sp.]